MDPQTKQIKLSKSTKPNKKTSKKTTEKTKKETKKETKNGNARQKSIENQQHGSGFLASLSNKTLDIVDDKMTPLIAKISDNASKVVKSKLSEEAGMHLENSISSILNFAKHVAKINLNNRATRMENRVANAFKNRGLQSHMSEEDHKAFLKTVEDYQIEFNKIKSDQNLVGNAKKTMLYSLLDNLILIHFDLFEHLKDIYDLNEPSFVTMNIFRVLSKTNNLIVDIQNYIEINFSREKPNHDKSMKSFYF